ncbi:MAG: ATP-dependent helicase [Candidatus Krumholzibacteria bacterium]|nr:ATP-dependent helicase [Candidatus Krumholzibacteria bacterium]
MNLNDGQKTVVSASIDTPVNVVAGAGTGKTRVLVERYLRFLHDGVPPARILALTFTLKAAEEMRRRVFEEIERDRPELLRELYAAWIMNFHSFGYRVIRENAPALAIDPGADVATAADLKRLDRVVETRFVSGMIDGVPRDFDFGGAMPSPTRLSSLFDIYLGAVKKCRGDMIPVGHLLDACTNSDTEAYVANVRAISAVYDAYVGEMQRQNLIDFSDMITRSTRALVDNPDLAAVYREKFKHILVDEFQDTSTAQFELLKVLSGGSFSSVTVVGDEKQSIYRWRDARVENIRDFPGEELGLTENYRSRQNILDLAHELICMDKTFGHRGDAIKLIAHRSEPNKPIVVFHPVDDGERKQQNDAEAKALAAWIVGLTGGPGIGGVAAFEGVERGGVTGDTSLGYGDIAVLLRSVREHKVLPSIEREFRRAGIPYFVTGGADAGGSRSLELLSSFLSLLLPGDRRWELLHVLESPPFNVGHASLIELLGTDGDTPAGIDLFLSEDRIDQVKDSDARYRLGELRALIEKLQRDYASLDFRGFLASAIEELPFFQRYFAHGGSVRAAEEIVSELSDICDSLEKKREPGLWAFLEQLRAALDEKSFGKDKDLYVPPHHVRIMTIHQAKGLEFPAVAVVGIKPPRSDSDGFFVSKKTGVYSDRWKDWGRGYKGLEERENEKLMKKQEERCLLYVAITRAKDLLFVSSPYADGCERKRPSLFTDVLECIGEHRRFETTVIRSVSEVPRAVTPPTKEARPQPEEAAALFQQWCRTKELLREQKSMADVSISPIHFVNWTALEAYADCPLKFRYKHILKHTEMPSSDSESLVVEKGDIPEPVQVPKGVAPAEYGVIIHELLRELMTVGADGAAPAGGWIEETAIRLGVRRQRVAVVADRARPVIKSFLESELSRPGTDMRLEEPFQVRIDGAVYHGIFDRIDQTENEWRVIDYKIGQERETYVFQIAFYMWALRNITGSKNVTGQLCYLRENGVSVKSVDALQIDDHAVALDKSFVDGDFPAAPGPSCRTCPYSVTCLRNSA